MSRDNDLTVLYDGTCRLYASTSPTRDQHNMLLSFLRSIAQSPPGHLSTVHRSILRLYEGVPLTPDQDEELLAFLEGIAPGVDSSSGHAPFD